MGIKAGREAGAWPLRTPTRRQAARMKMRRPRLTSSVALQLIFLSGLQGAMWTYSGPEGQDHWPEHYPYCGGTFQSPIDIKSELMRFDPTLRPIQVQNYNLAPGEQLTLGNNGHSIQISLPHTMHISSLPHRYTAAQLHFHWGSRGRAAGSEHVVNSRQSAAEMHVVHFNSDRYPNVSTAVDKSDGLAVLGVLIEVGEFNPTFEHFLKFINGIKYMGQRVQIPGFNVRALLPARLDEYYRYDGSLTTPPCYPSVLWTVFRDRVTVSHQQFLALATALYASSAQDSAPLPLNNNYRRLQLPDSRTVLVSFKEDELPWSDSGLLVSVLVGSAVGLALIVSLVCCLVRRKRSSTEQDKSNGVGFSVGDRDEYGSRV
ncbi:carbonic anhydrase 12 isoform X2 [Betta splendens]|uniref:carbonic anhydrase n=1 Tax=Betta splendens TaxID=158456 RepID=A0A8M1HFA3_BETSP|nr:carbonic anhydrase 12 isoform X2 [Betta splendens]